MRSILVLIMALVFVSGAWADEGNGLISKKSPYSVKKTLSRLEKILRNKGITIVKRWSHDKGGKKAGIPLRPTELLIFGNPKLGTHFFTSKQTAGIDLPMKALAWKGEDGQVWLTYNDPYYIVKRHGIEDRKEVAQKMSAALDKMTNAAIAQQ